MAFIKSKPNEYLVGVKSGKITNLGVARSSFIWPGQSFILVPSTQIEAEFAMTQETSDGIALRFKGIVVYHIDRPEIAAQKFDFSAEDGPSQINHFISNVCLGELRDTVSHMKMQECINERKTTLTDAITQEISKVVESWGIKISIVQVAQVFIVEEKIRRQLEAEVRNTLRANSELSDIKTAEAISLEESASKVRIKEEESENEKKVMALDTPLKIYEAEQDLLTMAKMLELYTLKEQMNKQKAKANLAVEVEENKVRKEMITLAQIPQIADSMSKVFQGANLTFYKDSSDVMAGLKPVMDLLGDALTPSL